MSTADLLHATLLVVQNLMQAWGHKGRFEGQSNFTILRGFKHSACRNPDCEMVSVRVWTEFKSSLWDSCELCGASGKLVQFCSTECLMQHKKAVHIKDSPAVLFADDDCRFADLALIDALKKVMSIPNVHAVLCRTANDWCTRTREAGSLVLFVDETRLLQTMEEAHLSVEKKIDRLSMLPVHALHFLKDLFGHAHYETGDTSLGFTFAAYEARKQVQLSDHHTQCVVMFSTVSVPPRSSGLEMVMRLQFSESALANCSPLT